VDSVVVDLSLSFCGLELSVCNSDRHLLHAELDCSSIDMYDARLGSNNIYTIGIYGYVERVSSQVQLEFSLNIKMKWLV